MRVTYVLLDIVFSTVSKGAVRVVRIVITCCGQEKREGVGVEGWRNEQRAREWEERHRSVVKGSHERSQERFEVWQGEYQSGKQASFSILRNSSVFVETLLMFKRPSTQVAIHNVHVLWSPSCPLVLPMPINHSKIARIPSKNTSASPR